MTSISRRHFQVARIGPHLLEEFLAFRALAEVRLNFLHQFRRQSSGHHGHCVRPNFGAGHAAEVGFGRAGRPECPEADSAS
jgi:hypothetical protein